MLAVLGIANLLRNVPNGCVDLTVCLFSAVTRCVVITVMRLVTISDYCVPDTVISMCPDLLVPIDYTFVIPTCREQ